MDIEKCVGCKVYAESINLEVKVEDYCPGYHFYLTTNRICPCATCIVKCVCPITTSCSEIDSGKKYWNECF